MHGPLFRHTPSVVALALVGLLTASASAVNYTTSFGVPNTFLNPTGWTVGDTDSTYQEWDVKTPPGSAGGLPIDAPPDDPAGLGTVTFGAPTHSAKPPHFGVGFDFTGGALLTSSGNYYAFGPPASNPTAEFGATADIFNSTDSFGPTFGTHVIIQTGSSITSGEGNLPGTMIIVEHDDTPIPGGGSGDVLQASPGTTYTDILTANGLVDYQEFTYEFFLSGYTDDFKIDWDQEYSATIDTLRVDSMIAEAPFDLLQVSQSTTSFVPEPSTLSLVLLGSLMAVRLRRRRFCKGA